MAIDNAKNFSKVTVSIGYDASALSVVLATGHGAKLPTASFNAVWWNFTDYPDPSDDPNVEIVRVTVVATDTLTITRAQEGTSASTKNTGGKTYKMIAGLTAKVINTDIPSVLVSKGTTTQIPYMNSGGTDFLYSSGLTFGSNVFTVAGAGSTTGTKIQLTNTSTLAVNNLISQNYTFNSGSHGEFGMIETSTATSGLADFFWRTWNGSAFTDRMKLSSAGNLQLLADNQLLQFGTGQDVSISYTGTDWLFNTVGQLPTSAIKFNSNRANTNFMIDGQFYTGGYNFMTFNSVLASLKMGRTATAGSLNYDNFAFQGGTASGGNSTAFNNSTSTGSSSFSANSSIVTSTNGCSFNVSNVAGDYAAGFGSSSVSGNYSFGCGYNTTASATSSVAMGSYTKAINQGAVAIGINGGANTTDFIAGNGTGGYYGQIALGYATGGGGVISSFTLANGGYGYIDTEVLTIVGGDNGATFSVDSTTTSTGAIVTSNFDGAGSGYTVSDTLTVTTGNSNATYNVDSIDVPTGAVIAINSIDGAGTGYTQYDTLTISTGNANATVSVDSVGGSGEVLGVTLTSAGTGYTTSTFNGTTGGTGGGCTLDISAYDTSLGQITGVTMTNAGTGYSVGATQSTTGGTGTGATINVTLIDGGTILTTTLISGGTGYTSANNVSGSGGSGSGALVNTTANGLQQMIAEGTGSVAIGQDVLSKTNNNCIVIGRGFTATTQDSFNIGFGQLDMTSTGGRLNSRNGFASGGTNGISATITTAKITPVTGANGSMTFVNGILTAQTQAT